MRDLESQLMAARQRIDDMLRDLRAGAPAVSFLVRTLALASDLTSSMFEAVASQIRKDPR